MEPKVFETIFKFGERLYSQKGMSPQFLSAFKKKTKKIHESMISSGTNNKPTKRIAKKPR